MADNRLEILKNMVAQNPSDITANLAMAMLAYRTLDMKGAKEAYETALKIDPSNVKALNNLAWLYQQAGDPRARRLAERAYLLAPDLPQTADTLAWILVQKGEPGVALGLLRKASAATPGSHRFVTTRPAIALISAPAMTMARMEGRR